MRISSHFIALLAISISLTGCAPRPHDTGTLDDLQRMHVNPITRKSKNAVSSIRLQALQDTAMSISARSGLAMQAKTINAQLELQDRHLSKAFNFNGLLLPHNVLPPVLAEGRETLNLADDETIRISDRTYKIVSQARFVTTPPHWREYLWMDYQKPEVPNAVLLPKNAAEKKEWDKAIKTGWVQGQKQAEQILTDNLARLKRDYAGMVLYRKLLAQRMVSAPFVARTDLGVTGGGSDMRVNDQVLRITALPSLQSNSKTWKALPVTEAPPPMPTDWGVETAARPTGWGPPRTQNMKNK
jgi:defect-in-organelle-trafficking protein DotC